MSQIFGITGDSHAKVLRAVGAGSLTAAVTANAFTTIARFDTHDNAYVRYQNFRGSHILYRTWIHFPLDDPSLTALRPEHGEITKVSFHFRRSLASTLDGTNDGFYILNSPATGRDHDIFAPTTANWNNTTGTIGFAVDNEAEAVSPSAHRISVGTTFGSIGTLSAELTGGLTSQIKKWNFGESACGTLCFLSAYDYDTLVFNAAPEELSHPEDSNIYVCTEMQNDSNQYVPVLKLTQGSTNNDFVDNVKTVEVEDAAEIVTPPGVEIESINGIPFDRINSLTPGRRAEVNLFFEEFDSLTGTDLSNYGWTNNILTGTTDNREYGWLIDDNGTPSSGTGPNRPGTSPTGNYLKPWGNEGYQDSTKYMYMESSGRHNCTFVTATPNINLNSSTVIASGLKCHFYIHAMANNLNSMGSFQVFWVGVTGGTLSSNDGTTASTHVHGPLEMTLFNIDNASPTAAFQLGLEANNNTVGVPASGLTTGRIQTSQTDDYQLVTVDLSQFHGTTGRVQFVGLSRQFSSSQNNNAGRGTTKYFLNDMCIDRVSITGFAV